jgi:hypothetical protein
MKFRETLLAIILVLVIAICKSYPQNLEKRVDSARVQIDTILSKTIKYKHYNVGEVIDVDSSIHNPGIEDGNISDPYGTLKQCYLFMAGVYDYTMAEEKCVIGIYKNHSIIWISGVLPGSQYYEFPIGDNGFQAVKDLNKMGKVDIAVYFSNGTNPPSEYYLWIFSWDGKKAKCINQLEKNGETSIASDGPFEIKDVDRDGIYDVISYSIDNSTSEGFKVNVIYKWNGSIYTDEKPTEKNRSNK